MSAIEIGSKFQAVQRSLFDKTAGQFRRPNWAKYLRKPARLDVATVTTSKLLNRVQDRLSGSIDDVGIAMKDLLSTLSSIKFGVTPDVWKRVMSQCLAHPVRQMIHQDPFAFRCFTKPRGYAGDAVLIDYLYSRTYQASEHDNVSVLGQRIFDFTQEIPAGHAVRKRRDIMALIIDELCDASTQPPHILSVACGHLREAQLSKSVAEQRTGRFVALDQDELSLKLVEREIGGKGITPFYSSIKALFRSSISHDKFDLVYSTGLYDYLDDRIATKLTHRMFEMLKPKGRLVVANFLPHLWCSAYMEALLDWNLIYRDPEKMLTLCSTIPAAEIAKCTTFVEENQNIVFLEMVKR